MLREAIYTLPLSVSLDFGHLYVFISLTKLHLRAAKRCYFIYIIKCGVCRIHQKSVFIMHDTPRFTKTPSINHWGFCATLLSYSTSPIFKFYLFIDEHYKNNSKIQKSLVNKALEKAEATHPVALLEMGWAPSRHDRHQQYSQKIKRSTSLQSSKRDKTPGENTLQKRWQRTCAEWRMQAKRKISSWRLSKDHLEFPNMMTIRLPRAVAS